MEKATILREENVIFRRFHGLYCFLPTVFAVCHRGQDNCRWLRREGNSGLWTRIPRNISSLNWKSKILYFYLPSTSYHHHHHHTEERNRNVTMEWKHEILSWNIENHPRKHSKLQFQFQNMRIIKINWRNICLEFSWASLASWAV